jgi:hypothetical protein
MMCGISCSLRTSYYAIILRRWQQLRSSLPFRRVRRVRVIIQVLVVDKREFQSSERFPFTVRIRLDLVKEVGDYVSVWTLCAILVATITKQFMQPRRHLSRISTISHQSCAKNAERVDVCFGGIGSPVPDDLGGTVINMTIIAKQGGL